MSIGVRTPRRSPRMAHMPYALRDDTRNHVRNCFGRTDPYVHYSLTRLGGSSFRMMEALSDWDR